LQEVSSTRPWRVVASKMRMAWRVAASMTLWSAELIAAGGGKRAVVEGLEVADGSDDVEKGDGGCFLGELVAAADAATSLEETLSSQLLKHFGEVVGGDVGTMGDCHRGDQLVGVCRENGHRPQGVFGGL
jgi:hypothetical protein